MRKIEIEIDVDNNSEWSAVLGDIDYDDDQVLEAVASLIESATRFCGAPRRGGVRLTRVSNLQPKPGDPDDDDQGLRSQQDSGEAA